VQLLGSFPAPLSICLIMSRIICERRNF
jgi:hypothetical protein